MNSCSIPGSPGWAYLGVGGSRQQSTGAEGKDVIVQVPLGTIAKNSETGEPIFEITKNGEEKILAKGASSFFQYASGTLFPNPCLHEPLR